MQISEIKKGQSFWEKNYEFRALTDAWRVEESSERFAGWEVDGVHCGATTHFYAADKAGCYGPKLYNHCAYMGAKYNIEPTPQESIQS